MTMEDERTTKSAENVSMNANRVSEQKSYTALITKAKEQGKEPSAIESEIYPSHKSHDLCSVYFALRGKGSFARKGWLKWQGIHL